MNSKQHYATSLRQAKVMQKAGLCLQAGTGITSTQRNAGPGAWEALLEIMKSSEAELDWLSKATWRFLGLMCELGVTSRWTPPAGSSLTRRTLAAPEDWPKAQEH